MPRPAPTRCTPPQRPPPPSPTDHSAHARNPAEGVRCAGFRPEVSTAIGTFGRPVHHPEPPRPRTIAAAPSTTPGSPPPRPHAPEHPHRCGVDAGSSRSTAVTRAVRRAGVGVGVGCRRSAWPRRHRPPADPGGGDPVGWCEDIDRVPGRGGCRCGQRSRTAVFVQYPEDPGAGRRRRDPLRADRDRVQRHAVVPGHRRRRRRVLADLHRSRRLERDHPVPGLHGDDRPHPGHPRSRLWLLPAGSDSLLWLTVTPAATPGTRRSPTSSGGSSHTPSCSPSTADTRGGCAAPRTAPSTPPDAPRSRPDPKGTDAIHQRPAHQPRPRPRHPRRQHVDLHLSLAGDLYASVRGGAHWGTPRSSAAEPSSPWMRPSPSPSTTTTSRT
ncbi:hypothetical protein JYK04_00420 [Streptomyces nojiriensis]|nr:hypothetical protein JYK04_00420 [Streptomyces nojiriensis]